MQFVGLNFCQTQVGQIRASRCVGRRMIVNYSALGYENTVEDADGLELVLCTWHRSAPTMHWRMARCPSAVGQWRYVHTIVFRSRLNYYKNQDGAEQSCGLRVVVDGLLCHLRRWREMNMHRVGMFLIHSAK